MLDIDGLYADSWLEAVLLGHPSIVDCAVIGLKPPRNSDAELPRAYVVRREGTSITEDEVKGLIKERLASYKQLTGGVRFLDEIPKSASGKILKRVLRDKAQKETGRDANAVPVVNAKL